VRRRSDGQVGTLEFTHHPRVYFGWRPDGELGPARAAATEAVTRAPEARQLRLAGLHPCSGQGDRTTNQQARSRSRPRSSRRWSR
jgi:hypothetical protein